MISLFPYQTCYMPWVFAWHQTLWLMQTNFYQQWCWTHPVETFLKDIIKKVVDPYLAKQKNNIISQACDDLRSMSNSTILCMDVGHSSARNSQAATLAAACGNILLFMLTDTHTNALSFKTINIYWLKQSSLVAREKFVIRNFLSRMWFWIPEGQ